MIPQDYWPGPSLWPPRMPPGTPQPIVPGEIPGTQPTGFAPPGGPNAGPTDTVPAWLTPGEAVLNRNAANLAGRGNINDLNKLGGAMGYAQGVGYVDPKDIDPMQQNIQLNAASISPAFISELKAKAAQSGISSVAFNGLLQAVMKEVGKSGQAMPPSANYLGAGSATPVYGESGYPSGIPVQGYAHGSGGVPVPGGPGGGAGPPGSWSDPGILPMNRFREGPGGISERNPEFSFRDYDWQTNNQWSSSNPWLNMYYAGGNPSTFNYNFNPNDPHQNQWTQDPTFFNSQGYPYAPPVFDPNLSYNPLPAYGGRHAFPNRQGQ